nr:MAG TPA: hypothetical protein [Caudoviricetes sp.]
MAVKLSGTLADITTRPIKEVTTVTIKAPYYRVGTQITTSQPEKVDVDASGSFSVSVTEGVGYLYIEGPGWSDSIKFLAAAGMKTIVEAIANAAGVPGMVDFLRLLSATDDEIAKRAAAAVTAAAAGIRFQKGALKDGDNLNDFGDSGAWDHTFVTSKAVANLPVDRPGVFYVFAGTDGGTNKVTIQFYAAEGYGGIWWRIRNKNGAWQDWQQLDQFQQERRREIPTGADFNTLVEPGLYKRVLADNTAKNSPHGNPGNLTVFATDNPFGYVSQLWAGATNSGLWFRANTVEGWNEWVRLDENTESNPDAIGTGSGRREYLVSDFYDRKGGEIGTGGKAAIALRFDHWMDDFYSKVLPLLKKYNLPWAQAMNSRTDNQQSAGMNWGQLQSTAISTGGEVLNHSATHNDPKSIEAVVDEVVTGLAELESKLPLLPIDGWMQPGTGGRFMGYANYATREDFGTEAARIVMANHAVVYGHHGGVIHRLDGRIRIGQRHRGMDNDTAANVKKDIDELIRVKGGMVLMVHPTKLNARGGTRLSEYEAVLSYIAQKRDEGELVVLSTTGLQAANCAHAIRRELTYMNVTSANASRTADISNFMADGPHEVHAVVKAAGTVSVSVSSDSGGLNQTWTQKVDGWQELWLPFTLPKGVGKVTTKVTGASEGRISVRAL